MTKPLEISGLWWYAEKWTRTLEEIIWKSQVYNPSGLKALEQVLGNTLPKYMDPMRFILGNYIAPADIHKRPLAKLTQDVAKQLGLL